MLTRRTPMRRTSWAPTPRQDRPAPVVRPLVRRGVYTSDEHMEQRPKLDLQRSRPYREAVAKLRCIFCGAENRSNHAHANSGKGKALKEDDRNAFPLCVDQPGQEGCHTQHDQRRLIPNLSRELYAALEAEWARRTRAQIIDAGLWPANLERIE